MKTVRAHKSDSVISVIRNDKIINILVRPSLVLGGQMVTPIVK